MWCKETCIHACLSWMHTNVVTNICGKQSNILKSQANKMHLKFADSTQHLPKGHRTRVQTMPYE